MSKVIERLVFLQLSQYLHTNKLLPSVQSAYRSGYSTETAVLKVASDIWDAMDDGKVTLLGLLDLSAAFDMVDHEILIQRLHVSYGISGNVLDWLKSFVTRRHQIVSFNERTAVTTDLLYGVPQGSVLGPLLFVMYTADVCDIVTAHGLGNHAYADDHQMYVHCKPADIKAAVSSFQVCFSEVERWMRANRLKLNADKTELMWFGTKTNLKKCHMHTIRLGSSDIKVSSTVKILGVIFDPEMSFVFQVSSVITTCFFQLRQIRPICRFLTTVAAKTLVKAFVCSRVDYCKAIYLGSTAKCQRRLQSILNAAARLITGQRKFDHISDSLRNLHWLRVPQRCKFKVACITRRCL